MTKTLSVSKQFELPPVPKPLVLRPLSPRVLLDVLKRAEAVGKRGAVVFDLDATVFNNHPRWVRILKEYGQARGLAALAACREDLLHDRSVYLSMVECGIDPKIAKELEQDAYAFWAERFYSSEYCLEDKPIAGAVEYLKQIQKTGAQIIYATGRSQHMVEGTIACMKREQMPIPDGIHVHILAKPDAKIHLETSDDEWKDEVNAHLQELAEIVAVFDNEPTHINGYHMAFPLAQAVHLLTDDSGRGVSVLTDIPSIKNFVLPT